MHSARGSGGARTCCTPRNPQSLAAGCPRNSPPRRRRPLPTDQCQLGASLAVPHSREPGNSHQWGGSPLPGGPGGSPRDVGESPALRSLRSWGGSPGTRRHPVPPKVPEGSPRAHTSPGARGGSPAPVGTEERGGSRTRGVPKSGISPSPHAPRCTHLRADPHLLSPRVPPAVTMTRGGHVPGLRGARVAGGSGGTGGGLRYVPSAAPARGGAVRSGAVRRRDSSPTRSRALPRTAAIVCG